MVSQQKRRSAWCPPATSLTVSAALRSLLCGGRHEALRLDIGVVEQEAFHLRGQEFARLRVGQIQMVFIDQACLGGHPLRPGLFRNMLPYAFAELAGVGREIQPFGFAPELGALNHACHMNLVFKSWGFLLSR